MIGSSPARYVRFPQDSSVLVILQIVYPGFLNSFSGLFKMSGL